MSGKLVEFRVPAVMPPTAGYSHISIVSHNAKTIYISGQVGLDDKGTLVGEGDFASQAEQAFKNIGLALADVGADFRHLVKIGMYLTDMAYLSELREVRDRYIDKTAPPASTLLQVSGFFRPDILFEIEAVAVLPE